MKIVWIPTFLLAAGAAFSASGVYSVRDFGATGDGKTLDTAAINKAIDACTAAGGGQVLLPPGTYLSGTVVLKSNVMLRLDAGARLLGTSDLTQYKNYNPPAGSFEARSPRWQNALVLISGVENVGISGEGIIDGNKVNDPRGEERMRGPHALVAGSSKNLTIRDVHFKDAANYAMLIEWTDEVNIQNVKATGGWDGIHLRWCKNVVISGCQLYTGDDAIAGRYWENVLITQCVLNSSCNGIRVIGPAKGLIIQNSLIYGPGLHPHRTSNRYNLLAGIYLQPGSWDPSEGALDDVLISDITMRNPATPFRLTMNKNNKGGEIIFNRISATGVYRGGILLESKDDPVQRVVLRDINIEYTKDDPALKAEHRPLPAWGLTARHLKNLLFENVRLTALERDWRPMMILDDIEDVSVDGMRFPPTAGEGASIVMNNVRRQEIRDAGAALLDARCTALGAAEAPVAGKPYSATATVVNGAAAGLGKVELQAGEQDLIRWVWLKPNETRKVVFDGVMAAAGTQELR
ncbi:MAG: glycosyl hydrolase family 28-related protein [Candidatus Solibacter sp.]|nr:glycosyl hydrolase family 28-related protein [Candidatus Solibacter sp.]